MSEAGYADLVTAANRALGVPVILIWTISPPIAAPPGTSWPVHRPAS